MIIIKYFIIIINLLKFVLFFKQMAGLDDYQFYTNLREKDSPFWQKSHDSTRDMGMSDLVDAPMKRPTEFPQKLKGTPFPTSIKPTQRQLELDQYSNKGSLHY